MLTRKSMIAAAMIAASSAAAQTNTPDRDAIEHVLNDFHRAAATADADRYFGHFTPDGFFLGSDGTERWTVPEFRDWSKKYFARKSAWTFVPRQRFVMFPPDQTATKRVAWFDEIARSEHMGDCRGTGVLRKIDGKWRIAHYSLTVLVPNDVLNRVAKIVRAHEAASPETAAQPATAETTVYIIRHAEKDSGDDPGLTDRGRARADAFARALGPNEISAVYATEYRRTRETVGPIAKHAGVETTVVGARKLREQVRLLKTKHAGEHVVVAGHSNTVPMLLRALGAKDRVHLTDDDYGDLFIVRLIPGRDPIVLRLKIGPKPDNEK